MKPFYYQSTRGHSQKVSASQAICQGLAPDGGLYVPECVPEYSPVRLKELLQLPYRTLAVEILADFLADYTREELEKCVRLAYTEEKFGGTAPTVLYPLSEKTGVLELWHGPTCAFKDMALQLLPQLLSVALQKNAPGKTAVILVATSGDTGKAALEGFCNAEHTKIAVFYPQNGVSDMQKRQMQTQAGENVFVHAIDGNFDDAQTGVKKIFGDSAFAAELAEKNCFLSSANSINWGRLLPQIVYYFYAYAQAVQQGQISLGEKINFCVPTGNFGNILAAYYAKKMGLPVKTLLCASNRNRVLTDFLTTGRYDRNRTFYLTQSPSMDILISSNLERLLYDAAVQNAALTADLQKQLAENGAYTVPEEMLAAIQAQFAAGYADDAACSEQIAATFAQYKYTLDPHTAVAMRVYEDYRKQTGDNTYTVVASTASPYKFSGSVLAALGKAVPEDPFVSVGLLHEICGLPVPLPLRELKNKPVRFTASCSPLQMKAALRPFIDG